MTDPPPIRHNFRTLAVAMAAGLLAMLLLGSLARVRPYDRDEGFYAMAADRVAAGEQPWRDFIYPQGPLYPLLLSVFDDFVDDPRWIPVLFGALTTALLVFAVARRRGVALAAVIGLLMLTSEQVAVWIPTLKTYAPTNFFSMASLLVLLSGPRRPKLVRVLLAGLLLGTAGLIRIPAMVLLLPLSAGIWLTNRGRSEAWTSIAVFSAVTLATFTIGCVSTGATFSEMMINAVSPHEHSVTQQWHQRWAVLRSWLGQPQLICLVALGGTSLWQCWKDPNAARPETTASLLAASMLTVGYLLASPTWDQYFVLIVPFWLMGCVPALSALRFSGVRRMIVGVLLVAAWTYGAVHGYAAATSSPYPYQSWFQRSRVAHVREFLKQSCEPGSTVASIWPGYVAGTGLEPLPGLESTVALELADRLTPDQVHRAPVMSRAGLIAELEAGHPRAVVLTVEDVTHYAISPGNFPRYTVAYSDSFILVLLR